MSEANQVNSMDETQPLQESVSANTLNTLFTQLNPGHIEQFYQSYQLWILQQQRVALLTQIATLQQKVVEHAEQMQGLAPSALALASLTQLQACGVEDIDLLERILERGEVWLDHTIQLLGRCEQLDIIGGDYTEWCEHALDGAYDWIASIAENTDETSSTLAKIEKASIDAVEGISDQITEELILQKLMSDDEEVNETEKVPVVEISRITQPLLIQDVVSSGNESTEIQDSINGQLDSSSLDAEGIEASPDIQAYQPSTELSLDAQLTGSIPVEHQQAGDIVDLGTEQSVELEGSGIASAQEEEKPQQEAVPTSQRGFLQRLLARIWDR